MQLRLGVSDGAVEQLGDFMVLISFDLMQEKIVRQPSGSSSRARRRAMRSTTPERSGSVLPKSRCSEGDSAAHGSSRDTVGGDLRRRSFISTVFTATRYSQVENAASPRNEPTVRKT